MTTGSEDGTGVAGRPLTGRTALLLFVGFFGVVFAVNGVMLTMALGTNSGVVAVEPYRKGLRYNERIAADAEQTARGWSSEMKLAPDRRQLVVSLSDRAGRPVDGLRMVAVVGRPSTSRQDLRLEPQPVGPGRYAAALPALEAGAYVASLEVVAARDAATSPPRDSAADGEADIVYRARRRLWVDP